MVEQKKWLMGKVLEQEVERDEEAAARDAAEDELADAAATIRSLESKVWLDGNSTEQQLLSCSAFVAYLATDVDSAECSSGSLRLARAEPGHVV